MWTKRLSLLLFILGVPVVGVLGFAAYQDWDVEQRAAKVEALMAEGKLGQALNSAQYLQRKYPNRWEGWILAGRIYHDRWRPESAEMYLTAYATKAQGFPALADLTLALGLSGQAKLKVKSLLDAHAAAYPDDPGLTEAHILAVADFLVQHDSSEATQAKMMKALKALVQDFRSQPRTTSEQYYHESEALMLLKRWDEATEAMERGIAANTRLWERLIMQMGLAFIRLHQNREGEAMGLMEEYVKLYSEWPGYHFAMRMPMTEFLQLTWRVRFGEDLAIPESVAARREAAQKAGVDVQFGTEETRQLLQAVIDADREGDAQTVIAGVSDLLVMLVRDRGCVTETSIVRPHILCMVMVLRSGYLQQMGDLDAALNDMVRAAALYPEDTWLQDKLQALQAEVAPQG